MHSTTVSKMHIAHVTYYSMTPGNELDWHFIRYLVTAVLSLFPSYSSSFCHREKAHGIGFHTARMYVSPLFFPVSLSALSTQLKVEFEL